jgi:hypothetical protein
VSERSSESAIDEEVDSNARLVPGIRQHRRPEVPRSRRLDRVRAGASRGAAPSVLKDTECALDLASFLVAAENVTNSFRSHACALSVFGDFSTFVSHAR